MSKYWKLAWNDMKENILSERVYLRTEFGTYEYRYFNDGTSGIEISQDVSENWVAGEQQVFTKESKRLNRLLGI